MNRLAMFGKGMLLAGAIAGSILVLPAGAQAPSPAGQSAQGAATYHNRPGRPKRAQMYYEGIWGVDSLRVKLAESGELIRFSWRVLDPTKAAPLNDKKIEPSLIDPQAGISLVVPTMAKVGQLRQTSTPQAGRSFGMAVSNQGRRVKRGDRVVVSIGSFMADGLEVE